MAAISFTLIRIGFDLAGYKRAEPRFVNHTPGRLVVPFPGSL